MPITRQYDRCSGMGRVFYTRDYPDMWGDIGEYTYGPLYIDGQRLPDNVKVGKYCSIAKGATIIINSEHNTDWFTTYPFSRWNPCIKGHPKSRGDVIIGNDVWIGHEAAILSGITIGDGAVIGARAVVTKDVKPYHIAVGNPAKVVRARFPDAVIKHLLKIRWWDRPRKEVEKLAPILCSNNVEALMGIT